MTLTDAQRAYSQIREKIITTELPPGSVIEIASLMAELSIGRTPIREALKLLETELLVTVSPRRGMFVTDVSITDLQHLHEIRLELDSFCAALAAGRMSHAERQEMRGLVRQLGEIQATADPQTLLQMDRRFHALLMQAANNRLLQAELEKLYNLSVRIWYVYADRLTARDLTQEAFCEILDAIEAGDAVRASRAMRRHICQFYEAVKQAL